MNSIRFQVSIPTDEGFLGRECSDSSCGRYFRVHADSVRDDLYCPYCGCGARNDDLFTKDQAAYLTEAAAERAKEHVLREVDKIFERTARRTRGNRNFRITYRKAPRRSGAVTPKYYEKKG